MSTISDAIKGMDFPQTPHIDTGVSPIIDNKKTEELATRLQQTSPVSELMKRIQNIEEGQTETNKKLEESSKQSSKLSKTSIIIAVITALLALGSLIFAALSYYRPCI